MTPKAFIETHGLTMEVFHAGLDMQTLMDDWRVTLHCPVGGRIQFEYHTGIGHRKMRRFIGFLYFCENLEKYAREPWTISKLKHESDRERALHMTEPTAPTAEDVILSVSSDIQCLESAPFFADFAADLGYNPDSRKAEKIYFTIQEEAAKMKTLLGRAGFNDLLEIQEE